MRVMVFDVGQRPYALPIEVVGQVVNPGVVTPVPFVPDWLEGVGAVDGRIVPQIRLSVRLGLEALGSTDPGAGQRLLVTAQGGLLLLAVDRVRRMVDVPSRDLVPVGSPGPAPEKHEEQENAREEVRFEEGGEEQRERTPPLLSKAVKGQFRLRDESVLLLDADVLGLDALEGVGRGAPGGAGFGGGGLHVAAAPARRASAPAASFGVLVVNVAGESYAFPIERVREVAPVGTLTPLPGAPPEVAGLAVLRAQPRLVLSLAALLGLSDPRPDSVLVAIEHNDVSLLFACPELVGLRRFSEDRRERTQADVLEAYLTDAQGKVTCLLSLERLLGPGRARMIRRFLPDTAPPVEAGGDLGPGKAPPPRRRVLLLKAGRETCALDIARIERIVPWVAPSGLPDALGDQVGVTAVGGRILPVADLPQLVEGEALDGPRSVYVVVQVNPARGETWALATSAVSRLVDLPAGTVRDEGGSGVVRGVGQVDGTLISLLDVGALRGSPPS
ncbi:chemotaxis protein CheW [Pararhodospirillum oryzae]|uniref:CheW-like domain-containing protein n=1 Tax=Pararhodospirillum oryzae TaxID=478448 RepID=A0A512H358_9PROT|nr:chemotaxis protein CheW [Pararhodospirillum oryzae]GEO79899.1 hypothetical protein ROR02_00300 [Pararhodospirillum oryzae]